MHLVDSNVWLALSIDLHSHYQVASDWFSSVTRAGSLLFCRSTQQSFLRLLTLKSVFDPYGIAPLTNQGALHAYDRLLAEGLVVFQPREPVGVTDLWREYASRSTSSPKLWMDAYLAAFAVAGGYRFVTTDTAFVQFSGLDLVLPGSDA
ncbi:MAG: TA system VapC family ribonuclease toxin [Thermomicrobiales bacterium]